ncbi:syntaxin-like [Paramacrobiotus metropolitanus]|uniref:syntaxin-like n=1 Tax=Paramacrobiotus metropolitanus TaxID=2943436 RepID=UPI0024457051|nr:syntaxin-like [Paramacrobiotus metropolitanus]
MPKDRLEELRASQKVKWNSQADEQVSISRQDSTDMFLAKVENVSDSLDSLSTKMDMLQQIHQRILNGLPSDPVADHEDQEHLLHDIIVISTNIRAELRTLGDDVARAENRPNRSATTRLRRAQHRELARRLLSLTSQYDREQITHRERLKERMRRQLKIADLDSRVRTDAEIEELLENRNPMIFSQQIIANSQQARDALADVEARHQDILSLEQNVKEIRDLMWEITNLVEQQGEICDRIEYNMEAAGGNMASGRQQIESARVSQKRARRCKIIAILVLVGVLVGVAIYLAVKFNG